MTLFNKTHLRILLFRIIIKSMPQQQRWTRSMIIPSIETIHGSVTFKAHQFGKGNQPRHLCMRHGICKGSVLECQYKNGSSGVWAISSKGYIPASRESLVWVGLVLRQPLGIIWNGLVQILRRFFDIAGQAKGYRFFIGRGSSPVWAASASGISCTSNASSGWLFIWCW